MADHCLAVRQVRNLYWLQSWDLRSCRYPRAVQRRRSLPAQGRGRGRMGEDDRPSAACQEPRILPPARQGGAHAALPSPDNIHTNAIEPAARNVRNGAVGLPVRRVSSAPSHCTSRYVPEFCFRVAVIVECNVRYVERRVCASGVPGWPPRVRTAWLPVFGRLRCHLQRAPGPEPEAGGDLPPHRRACAKWCGPRALLRCDPRHE